jgi:hypothetical protein
LISRALVRKARICRLVCGHIIAFIAAHGGLDIDEYALFSPACAARSRWIPAPDWVSASYTAYCSIETTKSNLLLPTRLCSKCCGWEPPNFAQQARGSWGFSWKLKIGEHLARRGSEMWFALFSTRSGPKSRRYAQ